MHGVWAIGAVVGGATVAIGLREGADVRALMVTGAIGFAVAGRAAGARLPAWKPAGPRPSGAGAAVGIEATTRREPQPALVIALGIVGATAFLTEGAATDWAGVHAMPARVGCAAGGW